MIEEGFLSYNELTFIDAAELMPVHRADRRSRRTRC